MQTTINLANNWRMQEKETAKKIQVIFTRKRILATASSASRCQYEQCNLEEVIT